MDKLKIRMPRHCLQFGRERLPFHRNVEMVEAKGTLKEYVKEAIKGPIVVTVRGRPIAFLTRVKGIDLEDLSMSTNPRFLEIIDRSRARTRKQGTVSLAEIVRRFGVERHKSRKATHN